MKKVILSSIASVALIFTLFFVPATKSSASELDADINSGLAEGEVVVDVYTDFVPDDETIGEEVFFEEDHSFTPLVRSLRWFGVSKTYQGHSYSSWKYAGASTVSGGRLTASHTKTVANRYSGTLKIPLRDLESVVGFDVTNTWSQTVGFVSKEYKSGRYRLEYRHVYKKYKVKQVQKYDPHPRAKVYATKYVYPQRWVERQYRVVKF
ncbi:hypothetical protein HOO54_12480 [Bacillus sp. WMMC1349]|uniref:hypothetical protein n=1 Tax=Bacillus sp. WMMC1349 TaxID=2736254 RepID=UPI0015529098|nr:hypothetical protein [Bacillus sp. WMMC1349]NPC93025.1 hypothetical protein [Bacillus sp. WMMC1349]